jgi:hypothetical protein
VRLLPASALRRLADRTSWPRSFDPAAVDEDLRHSGRVRLLSGAAVLAGVRSDRRIQRWFGTALEIPRDAAVPEKGNRERDASAGIDLDAPIRTVDFQ